MTATAASVRTLLVDGLCGALGRARDRLGELPSRVLFNVSGPGVASFIVDLSGSSPQVRDARERADVTVQATARDLTAILENQGASDAPTLLQRVRLLGDRDGFLRLLTVYYEARGLGGSFENDWYEELHTKVPDPEYVFMNFGYLAPEGPEDLPWVRPEDYRWRFQHNLVQHIVRNVVLAGARILDIGCGRGGTCSHLVRYHEPATVDGLDFSAEAIKFCTRVHRHDHLRFQQGDAQALPFADHSFDVVTNIESSHCYPSLPRFYAEVARVLTPGGAFCYTDCSPQPASHFERYFSRAGFEVVRYDDVSAGVERALRLNAKDLEKFLLSLANPSNEVLLRRLISGVNEERYRTFVNRTCFYHAWLIRTRPAS